MEQLLKEELNLVRQKELEKEKSWSLSEIQSKKDETSSSLGKEIQSITGEHYLKAEDKSDITALQENDTTTAHSKVCRCLPNTLNTPSKFLPHFCTQDCCEMPLVLIQKPKKYMNNIIDLH